MIVDIIYTLFSIAAFIGVFYILMVSLMKDFEKKKLDKTCPHCRVNTSKGWKSFLMPVR
jgi:hypothetical protein